MPLIKFPLSKNLSRGLPSSCRIVLLRRFLAASSESSFTVYSSNFLILKRGPRLPSWDVISILSFEFCFSPSKCILQFLALYKLSGQNLLYMITMDDIVHVKKTNFVLHYLLEFLSPVIRILQIQFISSKIKDDISLKFDDIDLLSGVVYQW